jgi:predicted transglutaminase-like cysteine proteinase
MQAVGTGFVAAFLMVSASADAYAEDIAAVGPSAPTYGSRFMVDFGEVDPPPAFKRFCNESPGECVARAPEKNFKQSPRHLEELDEINRLVNRAIRPETDIEHYGIEDYWTIPKDGRGDCEDYALLKRHLLIAMGWPTSDLLMTVVRVENGEGHAVLTARTPAGDLILDNRADEIKYWYQTAYKFKMRQSPENPRVWLDLDPADDELPAPIADLQYLFGVNRPALSGLGR